MPKMGRLLRADAGLAGALFSSAQLRLLGLLFGNPEQAFHASELIRLAKSGSGATQRELKKLADAGIVSVQASGNRKLYQANRQSPIFAELQGIVLKTVGLLEPLRRALAPHASNIEAAFVYGSVAKGKDKANSDIDLMIVGHDLSYVNLFASLQEAERTLLRQISPKLMTRREWNENLMRGEPFLSRILRQPKLFVLGQENELEGTR
jgi:predicted nucleotidyltransferase